MVNILRFGRKVLNCRVFVVVFLLGFSLINLLSSIGQTLIKSPTNRDDHKWNDVRRFSRTRNASGIEIRQQGIFTLYCLILLCCSFVCQSVCVCLSVYYFLICQFACFFFVGDLIWLKCCHYLQKCNYTRNVSNYLWYLSANMWRMVIKNNALQD